jgi:AraC family transcriptional activator of mtrCDE
MMQFTFQQGNSKELELFPHINEFALSRNNSVQLNSFAAGVSEDLRIYCVIEGKFDWVINQHQYTLYPGDVALALPGWQIGGANGVLDIGTVFRLHIQIEKDRKNSGMMLGEWSGLTGDERLAIINILLSNNVHTLKIEEVADILHDIRSEILRQEIGCLTRVNHLIDSILIIAARQSTAQSGSRKDFSRTLIKLEQTLRQKPAHQWTVEEMASLFGLGTTAFTEKVKSHTGFSPLNYLINIRISEAIKLLHGPHLNFTDIALETGFYSSQHFSTTFKKLTGYTPGEFRKRNILNAGSARLGPGIPEPV